MMKRPRISFKSEEFADNDRRTEEEEDETRPQFTTLPSETLQRVVSYLTPYDRLRLSVTCQKALVAVEALCQQKLWYLKQKHSPDRGFQSKILHRIHILRGNKSGSTRSPFKPPYRVMLWTAMIVPLYSIDRNGVLEESRQYFPIMKGILSLDVDDAGDDETTKNVLAVSHGADVHFFDLKQRRTLFTLAFDSSTTIGYVQQVLRVGNHLVVSFPSSIHVFTNNNKAGWKLKFIHRDGPPRIHEFDPPFVYWCTAAIDKNTLLYVRKVDRDDNNLHLVEVVSLDLVTETIVSSFRLDAEDARFKESSVEPSRSGTVYKVEAQVYRDRWLLAFFQLSGWVENRVVVYDLRNQKPIQFLETDLSDISPQSSSAVVPGKEIIYAANKVYNRVDMLELREDGYICELPRSSFYVESHQDNLYHELSVDFRTGLVVVSDHGGCHVYYGKTGEKVPRFPGFGRDAHRCHQSRAYPAMNELLVTKPSGDCLLDIYCLDEPWV